MNLLSVEYYSIAFIEKRRTGKNVVDYTNLFSQNDYKKMIK